MESDQSCSHCARHEEEDSNSDIRQKYAITALSTPTWVLAIATEFILFNTPVVYILSLVVMLLAGRWIIPRGIRGAASIHLDINF
ncbi:MAG: hypothetical protein ACFFCK_11540, partial [Promethearchaeota archaeon]